MPPVLNMPAVVIRQVCEYARVSNSSLTMPMREYALIILNMLECAWINRFLMSMSEFIRSLYKLLSSYQDLGVFRALSNIYNGAFCKDNSAWMQEATRNFQGRGSFMELRHFDKHFVENPRKKVPQGNILEFFS